MQNSPLARVLVLLGLFAGGSASVAQSHDLSHSQSTTTVSGAEVRMRLQLDLVGFGGLQWSGRDVVTYDELDTRIELVFSLIKEHLRLSSSSPLVSSSVVGYELVDNHVLQADLLLTFQRDVDALVLQSTLDRITSADHQHLAAVTLNGVGADALITAGASVARFEGAGSPWPTILNLVRAGSLRVLTRADNLLFLLLLVVARPTIRSLVVALAAVIAAQSVGIVIGALNLLTFSTASLTALIPMIVAALALANLLGGHQLDLVIVVSAFTLVQTLAQAEVLRATAIPSGRVAILLTAFCLGVVATQATLIAVVFPVSRIAAVGRRPVRPTVSIAVAGVAMYWLVQHSFLS